MKLTRRPKKSNDESIELSNPAPSERDLNPALPVEPVRFDDRSGMTGEAHDTAPGAAQDEAVDAASEDLPEGADLAGEELEESFDEDDPYAEPFELLSPMTVGAGLALLRVAVGGGHGSAAAPSPAPAPAPAPAAKTTRLTLSLASVVVPAGTDLGVDIYDAQGQRLLHVARFVPDASGQMQVHLGVDYTGAVMVRFSTGDTLAQPSMARAEAAAAATGPVFDLRAMATVDPANASRISVNVLSEALVRHVMGDRGGQGGQSSVQLPANATERLASAKAALSLKLGVSVPALDAAPETQVDGQGKTLPVNPVAVVLASLSSYGATTGHDDSQVIGALLQDGRDQVTQLLLVGAATDDRRTMASLASASSAVRTALLDGLPAQTVAQLPKSAIANIPAELLVTDTLLRLSTEQAGALGEDQKNAMTPSQRVAVSVALGEVVLNTARERSAGKALVFDAVLEDSADTSGHDLGLAPLAYAPGRGAAEAGQTLTYAMTAIPDFLTLWKAGDRRVVAGDVLTLDELRGLTYRTVADRHGSGSIRWSVTDSGATTAPHVHQLVDSLAVTVTAVNDAPTRTSGRLTAIRVDEDSAQATAVSLGLGDIVYGNGGGSDEAGQTLTCVITSIPSFVTLHKADGNAVLAGTSLTIADLQGLAFRTVPDASGSGTITWTVTDSGGSVAPDANQILEQLSLTVSAVNDAPTLTTVTTLTGFTEDTFREITYADLIAAADEADIDGDALSFRVEAVSSGTLQKWNGTAWSDATAGTLVGSGEKLQWKAAPNANGEINAFTVKAWDGALASATAIQVKATVTAVNDAPTLTTVSTFAGFTDNTFGEITCAQLLAAADEADIDGDTLGFRIEAVSTGSLQKFVSGAWADVVAGTTTVALGDKLQWKGVAGASGTLNAFTVKAWDGTAVSATAVQVRATVARANQAPTLTAVSTLTGLNEDIYGDITYEQLVAAADEADADGDTLGFRIEAVSSGTLQKLVGAVWTDVVPGTTIVSAGEKLQWKGAANANGTLNAFTVKAWDGKVASATAVQVKVTLGALDDAPVRTSGSLGVLSKTLTDQSTNTLTSLGLGSVAYGAGGNGDEDSQTLSYAISAVPDHVLLYKSDLVTPVRAGTALSLAELRGLVFQMTKGGSASVQWQVTDTGRNTDLHQNTLTESLAVTVIDGIAPKLLSSSPADNATAAWLQADIVLTFDDVVKAGTGNIVVSNGTDTRTIAVTDTTQVSFSGSVMKVNPTTDLLPGQTYSVQLAAGVVLDAAGNAFAGVTDATTLNFTTAGTAAATTVTQYHASVLNTANSVAYAAPVTAGTARSVDGFYTAAPLKVVSGTPVHGWTFAASGTALALKNNDTGAYSLVNHNKTNLTAAGFQVLGAPLAIGYTGFGDKLIFSSTYATYLGFFNVAGMDATKTSLLSYTMSTGVLSLLSHNASAGNTRQGQGVTYQGFSADGRWVLFTAADASRFGNDDTAFTDAAVTATDLFAADTATGEIRLLSGADQTSLGSAVTYKGLSEDGNTVYYEVASVTGLKNGQSSTWVDPTGSGGTDLVAMRLNLIDLATESDTQGTGSRHDNVTTRRNLVLTAALPASSSAVLFDNGVEIPGAVATADANGIATWNLSGVTLGDHVYTLVDATFAAPRKQILLDGSAAASQLTVRVIDGESVAPSLLSISPGNKSLAIALDTSIVLTFDEAVRAAAGVVWLSNATETRSIDVTDTRQVTFSGSTMTIRPLQTLAGDSDYTIRMAAGVVQDASGNVHAGLGDGMTFHTVSSATLTPKLAAVPSLAGRTAVAVDSDIVLVFNKNVRAGSGRIVISDGTDVRTIAVTDTSQVTINGNTVTINPSADLWLSTQSSTSPTVANTVLTRTYSVRVDAGAFQDVDGRAYAGITDDTTLAFSTEASHVASLRKSGADTQRIGMVLVGDGFQAIHAGNGKFVPNAQTLVDHLFKGGSAGAGTQPFARHAQAFNVYALEVASVDEGIDFNSPATITKNTAFDSAQDLSIARALSIHAGKADMVVASSLVGTGITPVVKIAVLNTATYGGAGGTWASYSLEATAPLIAAHEIGHSFVSLADEYDYGGPTVHVAVEPAYPDVTIDRTGAKWSPWLGQYQDGIGVIGVYEGGDYSATGIYRASVDSKMRTLGKPWDLIAREAFMLAFYKHVRPLDAFSSASPAQTSLSVKPFDPTLIDLTWSVDGVVSSVISPWFDVTTLVAGTHTISVKAQDNSGWVRPSLMDSLTQNGSWTVTVQPALALGSGDNVHKIGSNLLDGGTGVNTASYQDFTNAVTASLLLAGVQQTSLNSRDTLLQIANLIGGAGADSLTGNGDVNWLSGLDGNDTLDGGDGNDVIDGGNGNDTIRAGRGNSRLIGGAGDDVLRAGNGVNVLYGEDGNDDIVGGSGDDTVLGGNGSNVLDGGGGINTLSYAGVTVNLTVSLASLTAQSTGWSTDTLQRFQRLIGGSGANVLNGRAGRDILTGGAGADTFVIDSAIGLSIVEPFLIDGLRVADASDRSVFYLTVGGGLKASCELKLVDSISLANGPYLPDTLSYAPLATLTGTSADGTVAGLVTALKADSDYATISSYDSISAGTGSHNGQIVVDFTTTGRIFMAANLKVAGLGIDLVSDFESGSDHLQLSSSVFTALGATTGGVLDASRLCQSPAAATASTRILYDATSGSLSYDPDGSGSASSAVLFAQLLNRPATLSANDVTVL